MVKLHDVIIMAWHTREHDCEDYAVMLPEVEQMGMWRTTIGVGIQGKCGARASVAKVVDAWLYLSWGAFIM